MWSEMCVTVLFLQCRSLLQTWKHLLWHTQSRLICVAGQLCVLLLPSSSHKWCFMAPFIYFITRVPDILGSVMIFGESWDVATEGGGQKGGGGVRLTGWFPPLSPVWNIAQVQNSILHRDNDTTTQLNPLYLCPPPRHSGLYVRVCVRVCVGLLSTVEATSSQCSVHQ